MKIRALLNIRNGQVLSIIRPRKGQTEVSPAAYGEPNPDFVPVEGTISGDDVVTLSEPKEDIIKREQFKRVDDCELAIDSEVVSVGNFEFATDGRELSRLKQSYDDMDDTETLAVRNKKGKKKELTRAQIKNVLKKINRRKIKLSNAKVDLEDEIEASEAPGSIDIDARLRELSGN